MRHHINNNVPQSMKLSVLEVEEGLMVEVVEEVVSVLMVEVEGVG